MKYILLSLLLFSCRSKQATVYRAPDYRPDTPTIIYYSRSDTGEAMPPRVIQYILRLQEKSIRDTDRVMGAVKRLACCGTWKDIDSSGHVVDSGMQGDERSGYSLFPAGSAAARKGHVDTINPWLMKGTVQGNITPEGDDSNTPALGYLIDNATGRRVSDSVGRIVVDTVKVKK